MYKTVKKPSKTFVQKLAKLTAENCHTECYKEVAMWGEENSKDKNDKIIFHMFVKMFDAMKEAHEYIGYLTFGDMRYEVGNKLDNEIIRVFGEKVLNEINKGR